MKVVGLIVEYNPLHNGHVLHYQQSKQKTNADASVAVMSGYFLQRGEPAMIGKWARAEMALALGVDLVLELPTAYCTQNAELFALGAVSTLHSLGIVDFISFGSESGEIAWIQSLAEYLKTEPESFKLKIKHNLKLGLPYPKAYAAAVSSLLNIPVEATQQPNNILGLNYVLALKRLNSSIQAVTIPRTKAGYHQKSITDQSIASATAIRKLIADKGIEEISPYVPQSTLDIMLRESESSRCPVDWDHFYPYLIHGLAAKSAKELGEIYEMDEGLEYRLKKYYNHARSFQELMQKIKTKRYTWNRLQRLLLYSLLNIKKEHIHSFGLHHGVPYIRVLGFNAKGRTLLHEAKKRSLAPIFTKVPKDAHAMFELDLRASAIYHLGQPNSWETKRLNDDYFRSPIII